jgi:proteasome lid subunit RPN8/RPN11
MFNPDVIEAARRDALDRYPAEACGIVTAHGYESHPNLALDPTLAFRMSADVDERIAHGDVLAVIHSHPITDPTDPDFPSVEDQQQQIAQGIPWGLTVVHGPDMAETPYFWGDGIPDVPIMPRNFRWGPAGTDGRGDCFALIRDWYRLHWGLTMAETPRGPNWLEEGPNLYLEGTQREGFTPIRQESLQYGDAILCAFGSGGRPNHAAVYLGDGTVLHHTENRMAQRHGYLALARAAVMFVRPPPRKATP